MSRDEVPQIPCLTCGAMPTGAYHDGSPLYSCYPGNEATHTPIYPGDPRYPKEPEKSVVVTLEEWDAEQADKCAKVRMEDIKKYRQKMGLKMKDKIGVDSVDNHYTGCLGEWMFFRWRGLEPFCTHGFDYMGGKPDVDGCQVRATTTVIRGMKLKDEDPDDVPVVDVVVQYRERVHAWRGWFRGWMYAGEARALLADHPEWISDPGNKGYPAPWIPPEVLRPMSELKRLLEERNGLLAS